jgi:AMP-activated protein kinase-like protein
VLKMPEPFEVPDRGTVPYQEIELNVDIPEERWIEAAELRPGNTAVVHHLVLYFHVPEPVNDKPNPSDVLINLIAGFAPGMPPAIYSPTACRRVPAGAKLMMQCHYTPNGTAQSDQSEVGIVFADPKNIKKEVTVAAAINPQFRIPPGDSDHQVQSRHIFREDTLLFALTPHMHLRGKAFRFEAMYPDGSKEILLDVPRYDFSWQNTYDLAKPKVMSEGTEIRCTGHFDNSAENLSNPDPTTPVLWGDQTWQEMMVGTMNISSVEQDLSLGPPRIKALKDGLYEVEFSYKPTTKPEAVYLAGEFNDWKPDGQRMDGPDAQGRYTAKAQLKAGEYLYKFVLDGKHWRADPGNPDHAGSNQNSVLHVGNKN